MDSLIFLTGFMGSGKSTLGKKLASLLSYNFVDLDEHIEQQHGKSIANIFQQEGETTFRELEKTHLEKLIHSEKNCVVSLGGGTLCFYENLDLVKQAGVLVYIDLPAKALAQRLTSTSSNRPLLHGLSGDALLHFIEQLLAQRLPYYDQAQIHLKGINLSAHDIYSALRAYSS